MEENQAITLDENRLIIPPDAEILKESFENNYSIYKNRRFFLYPRNTFHRERIPSPRQYLAYRGLIKTLGGSDKIITCDLKTIDLRTPYIMILDDKYENLFKEKDLGKYKLINTSGGFYTNTPDRRAKMVEFLKKLATRGCDVCIHTEAEDLEKDFFNDQDSDILRDKIKIIHINYRIDIHYTIFENTENPENTHYFLEYPHSEEFIFRLGFHFTNEDILSLGCYPKQVYNYLMGLRDGHYVEKFFHAMKRKFPWLKAPDIGLAVYL
jgi:hypothetical protein